MANQDNIFNCSFKKPLDPNLECNICKTVMVKPVTLNCGHSGCLKCFERLLDLQEQQKGDTTALCPLCRTMRFGRDALTVNFSMDRISSDLPLSCNNPDCMWEGKLGDAQNHQKQCTRSKEISCPLECGERILWCQLPLHLSVCPEKVISCRVPGCKQMFRRAMWDDHMVTCYMSHHTGFDAEIQKLKRAVYEKSNIDEKISTKEDSVSSFVWTFKETSATPVASPSHRMGSNRWRGVCKDGHLYLQLESAVNPVTTKARIILMPERKSETVVHTPIVRLKEGDLIGNVSTQGARKKRVI